jgi:hypothetical protein
MNITRFDDLLRSAREQSEPQRLLFVFTSAGVPDDATPEQRIRFEAGQGGTLTPLMCVDKAPDEWASFDALAEESRQLGQPWDIVFVAAMAGHDGHSPTSVDAEAPRQRRVESIKAGTIGGFIPFDGMGRTVQFG